MSTTSSSRDERGRQKPSDRGTAADPKQVKPAGGERSAESSPVRDEGKSDVEVWEAVFARENLFTALKRVESNRGAAGIDGMEVSDLCDYLKEHWLEVREALESGTYRPSPVRRVEIPKPDGGVRQLGIPTVMDRLIQQAIAQVLTPMFEPVFSPHSYGFRPGRSAHQAIQQAQTYIAEGNEWVVDIDLEKFFDRVNHDMLVARVARVVKDKRVLKLPLAPACKRRCPSLPEQRCDGERSGDGDRGRNAARRTAVPVALQHHAGRSGQGAGEARAQVCALCG